MGTCKPRFDVGKLNGQGCSFFFSENVDLVSIAKGGTTPSSFGSQSQQMLVDDQRIRRGLTISWAQP